MGFSFSIRDSKISFYNLSNHKHELDAPQISHITFPAIRYDVHFVCDCQSKRVPKTAFSALELLFWAGL